MKAEKITEGRDLLDTGNESYRKYLAGDDSAFGDIVRSYADGLCLYINSIVKDRGTAEELTQETFVKLAVKKPRFFGRSSFKGWLYTIGHNLAIDFLRKRQDSISLDEIAETVISDSDTEKRYLKSEDALALHRGIGKLKSEHAQALWLVYFEDFTPKEAARIMNRSHHAFENLLSRAKASLKREMEKEGYVYGL